MIRTVFLDCGTHEGQGLSELATKLPQGCEIHCFEPNPVVELNAATLIEVAKANGLTPSSLTIHQKAVYDHDGTVEFASIGGFPRGNMNGRGQSSSIVGVGQNGGVVKKSKVPCVDLLGFIRSLELEGDDEVHIKLDIEGAEFVTLKRLLAEGDDVFPFLKQMWIEWHGRYYASESWERNKGAVELTAKLQARGVEVHVWQ